MVKKRAAGKTWGMNLHKVYWLCTTVIRAMITCGSARKDRTGAL